MRAITRFRVLLFFTIPLNIGTFILEISIDSSDYYAPLPPWTSFASIFISTLLSILFCKCWESCLQNRVIYPQYGANNFGIQQPMMMGGYNYPQVIQPTGYMSYQQGMQPTGLNNFRGMQPMQNYMFPQPQNIYQQNQNYGLPPIQPAVNQSSVA